MPDMKHIPARITLVQRQALDQAGPVGAAARALLWLGIAAAGLPVPVEARREILSLLGEELAPSVLDALQRLADQLRARESGAVLLAGAVAPAASAARPPAPEPAARRPEVPPTPPEDDPYSSLGIEFEG
ncbi:MAG TPA: hypothetical protein VFS21_04580 [Roseiflexaceae bacterium]|nr:hypothetical protein [Roseiflexaceae bacterium]